MLCCRISAESAHIYGARAGSRTLNLGINQIRTGAFPSPRASDRPSARPHRRPTAPRTLPPGLRGGAGSRLLRSALRTRGRRARLAARPESAPPISRRREVLAFLDHQPAPVHHLLQARDETVPVESLRRAGRALAAYRLPSDRAGV